MPTEMESTASLSKVVRLVKGLEHFENQNIFNRETHFGLPSAHVLAFGMQLLRK